MKNYISSFTLIVLSICLFSCKKAEVDNITTPNTINVFGFTDFQEAKNQLGEYADAFEQTSGSMFVRSTRVGSSDFTRPEIFARFNPNGQTGTHADGGIFKFGPIEMLYNMEQGHYAPNPNIEQAYDDAPSIFGNEIDIAISSDNAAELSFKQYVPADLVVHYPNSAAVHANLLEVPRAETQVMWNADPQNSNGVIFYLWWNGATTGSLDLLEVSTVERAIKVPDTGIGQIPASFFQDIPKGAVITVYAIRGAVDLINHNNETYKFYTISENKYDLNLMN